MIYRIQPPLFSRVQASVQLPASKSISNRVLILNALSEGTQDMIENLSESEDTKVLQHALQSSDVDFDIGAAGTSMRFLTAYLSQRKGKWSITGTERMKKRPIQLLTDGLCRLGAEIDFIGEKGFPPLYIKGKSLEGGEISLNGGISSQYISALIMIAPMLKHGLTLYLEGTIVSRPYIEMTLRLMQFFGIESEWNENVIRIRSQKYHSCSFKVESDWSAASYWYETVALSSGDSLIKLFGLEEHSLQGDARGRFLFERLGVRTDFSMQKQEEEKQFPLLTLSRFPIKKEMVEFNLVNEPDLAQTFVVACCLMDMPFRFVGLQSLHIKETDRIKALKTEMRKLGYLIHEYSDSVMEWRGEKCEPQRDPIISTYEDHRMAMAFAPICLKLKEIKIQSPEVVRKSYPSYWRDLLQAGFKISNFQ